MPIRDESIKLTKVKMVSVPQHQLDAIETARQALYDLLAPHMKGADFSFQVKLQEITQPMWQVANTKWEESKS